MVVDLSMGTLIFQTRLFLQKGLLEAILSELRRVSTRTPQLSWGQYCPRKPSMSGLQFSSCYWSYCGYSTCLLPSPARLKAMYWGWIAAGGHVMPMNCLIRIYSTSIKRLQQTPNFTTSNCYLAIL